MFLYLIPLYLRVSGTMGQIIVRDVDEEAGIRDSGRYFCTGYHDTCGYRGRYDKLLYRMLLR